MKTANRKQQNTDNVGLLVENCDIKLEIFNKLAHLNQSETQITVMSELFFSQGYYNNNKMLRCTANQWVLGSIPATGWETMGLILDCCFLLCHKCTLPHSLCQPSIHPSILEIPELSKVSLSPSELLIGAS